MQEEPFNVPAYTGKRLYIAPAHHIYGEPVLPSSKYYTLRYLLAATLAQGDSTVSFPAASDDSDALFRGCRALGAELTWRDEQQQVLCVHGVVRPHHTEPVIINHGNARAARRPLLAVGRSRP